MATKEIHTDDVAIKQKAPVNIGLDTDLTVVRQNEDIITDVAASIKQDELEAMQFMEEQLTIRLERSSEKFAPSMVDVSVNGRTEIIPVGKPVKIARKYVDVLARCRSDAFQTVQHGSETSDFQLLRFTQQKYPFSVIQDPNPKGYEWLTNILGQ